MTDEISRREFVKQTAVGTAMLAASPKALEAAVAVPMDSNKQVVAALGALFIPSKVGDPGYSELEPYGISGYVMTNLPPSVTQFQVPSNAPTSVGENLQSFPTEGLDMFNVAAKQFFEGKNFLDLDEKQREQYLSLIADGSKIADQEQRTRLQTFYRRARSRILTVYYKNYPFQAVRRNAAGEPTLHPGDTHQITNPNVWKDKKIVTGWDIAGYKGPLTWEEEEKLREKAKKELPYWLEGDLVKLEPNRPPAAAAIKTSDGGEYYDVIVLGGGTAGCIVAGRLAERGINPKTGDRLKVAMIEGGDDWTIRDPGVRPGYGYPIRRRMITDIPDGIGPDGGGGGPMGIGPNYLWSEVGGTGGENFKLVGGCSLHYGGTCWIPGDEDFQFYREASGVDWDLAKFGDAIQEIRDMYHVSAPPDAWWSKGDHIWANAGRALGFEMRSTEQGRINTFGINGDLSRTDSKATSLPWAYIGLNNGLKVIANAEVQNIVIEKAPGGRPVATGAVYTDEAGATHEVRAARVVVALAANFTPLLLYKSGYGPREFLGDKLLAENKNVGHHLSGDHDLVSNAYLEQAVVEEGLAGEAHHGNPWAATTPRPWGELTIHVRGGAGSPGAPSGSALGQFAPAFGWEHKEYMRSGAGARRMMNWRTHLGAIPASWRILPDGKVEQVEADAPRIDAKIKEAGEIVRAWQSKLAVKPVKADLRAFSRTAKIIDPLHRTGTARAGSSPENSVCTSDFDCHDIDNLLITSSAAVPRTFFWSLGPTAVAAAYSYRRMIANHFSTGSSTKGFA